jgi:hypothetical protein
MPDAVTSQPSLVQSSAKPCPMSAGQNALPDNAQGKWYPGPGALPMQHAVRTNKRSDTHIKSLRAIVSKDFPKSACSLDGEVAARQEPPVDACTDRWLARQHSSAIHTEGCSSSKKGTAVAVVTQAGPFGGGELQDKKTTDYANRAEVNAARKRLWHQEAAEHDTMQCNSRVRGANPSLTVCGRLQQPVRDDKWGADAYKSCTFGASLDKGALLQQCLWSATVEQAKKAKVCASMSERSIDGAGHWEQVGALKQRSVQGNVCATSMEQRAAEVAEPWWYDRGAERPDLTCGPSSASEVDLWLAQAAPLHADHKGSQDARQGDVQEGSERGLSGKRDRAEHTHEGDILCEDMQSTPTTPGGGFPREHWRPVNISCPWVLPENNCKRKGRCYSAARGVAQGSDAQKQDTVSTRVLCCNDARCTGQGDQKCSVLNGVSCAKQHLEAHVRRSSCCSHELSTTVGNCITAENWSCGMHSNSNGTKHGGVANNIRATGSRGVSRSVLCLGQDACVSNSNSLSEGPSGKVQGRGPAAEDARKILDNDSARVIEPASQLEQQHMNAGSSAATHRSPWLGERVVGHTGKIGDTMNRTAAAKSSGAEPDGVMAGDQEGEEVDITSIAAAEQRHIMHLIQLQGRTCTTWDRSKDALAKGAKRQQSILALFRK